MKHFLAVLITALTLLFVGQASAATITFAGKSLDSLSSPLICVEDKKKKKKGDDEEEPECD